MKRLIDKLFKKLGYVPIEYFKRSSFYEQSIYDIKEVVCRNEFSKWEQKDLRLSDNDVIEISTKKMIHQLMAEIEPFIEFDEFTTPTDKWVLQGKLFIGKKIR